MSASAAPKKLTPQEAGQRYNMLRQEMKGIAQKITELEAEHDEHRLVLETLHQTESDRKCFRLIGGVLTERTVKDVLPAVEGNATGLKAILEQLMKQYKQKENEAVQVERDQQS